MLSDFNKIYTFMEVVRTKSFSKASNNLGISQPAVTLQIKKLEEILGVVVVIRKKNGIILTKEGEKFYNLCLKFENSMILFKEASARIKNDKIPMTVATNQLIGETILPMILDEICSITDSTLDVKIINNNNLASYLFEKRCDFCLMNDRIYNDRLVFKKMFEYEIILVANFEVGAIKINDLYKFNFIKDKTKSFIGSYLEKFGLQYDELPTTYALDGSVAVKSAVLNNKMNKYLAFLPKFMIENELKNQNIYHVKLDKINIIKELYIAALAENKELIDSLGNIKLNMHN